MKVNGLSSKMIVLVLLLAIAPQAQGHDMLAGGDHYPEAIEVTLDPPVVDMGRFTENLGQWEPHVTFVARCSFGDAVFGTDGVMYDVRTEGGGHRVKVAFDSGAPVDPAGVGDLGSSTSYFLGNAPDGWVSDARSFRQILYTDVWPGINVRYYFHDGALKYDVIVSADADPSPVRFTVEGHNGLDVGADVLDIRLSTDVRLQDRDLVAWYSDDGEAVPARFTDDDRDGGYGFSLDKEPGRELVIDPLVILASTFLGGTYADTAEDMVMDDEGNVYIAGTTVSTDFPVTTGAYSEAYKQQDLVVTKMDRNLTRVLWATYIGGMDEDTVASMDVDDKGNVHILGETVSEDFPVTAGALQTSIGGLVLGDIYALKLSSDGSSLQYATYIGGLYSEMAGCVKVHDGMAYVTGMTESSDFPYGGISGGYYIGAPFVMVLSVDGSRLETIMSWSVTRMVEPESMFIEEDGTVTIAGRTTSPDLPTTPGAYMEDGNVTATSFIIQCDPWTNDTILCTYYALSGIYASEVVLDGEGNIYMAGLAYAFSQGLPLTEGAWCTTYKGSRDLFVAKLDPLGSRVIYTTLVGGDNYDFAGDLKATNDGKAVFVGWSWRADNYDTTGNAHDKENDGSHEGFVLVLDEEGRTAVQSTYLGGQFGDYITSVEITPEGTLMLAGYTESKRFPVTEGAYQEELAGDRDIFVTELACLNPPSAPLNLTALGGEGNISLQWEPPLDLNGFPIVNYTIYRLIGEEELELIHTQGLQTAFVDEDVEYGTYYVYRVAAFNGKGMSLKSNMATARSVTVPDPPVNLTGMVHDNHIALIWKAPEFTGGLELEGFYLYRAVEGGEMEFLAQLRPEIESFGDIQVKDRLTYSYMVAAINEYGESRDNPVVNLRMTGIATPPLNLNHTYGDQYIELTWNEPEEDFDLPVDRYHVYRTLEDEPAILVGVTRDPDLVLRDSTVDVGITYRYHVVAENAKGMSDPSNEVVAKTMVVPDPPREAEAAANDVFVRITWSPPSFDGASPVTSYRIYVIGQGDADILLGNVNVAGVDEPQLVFLHEQAYDGVAREYFVTAVNVEGESDPSAATWSLMYTLPTPPLALDADWGDGQVVLTWSPPEDDGGAPLLSFRIFRRLVGTDSFIVLATLPASNLRYVDDEAINGVEYTYWTTVSNLAGESEPSSEVTVMPAGPPSAPLELMAEGLNGSVIISWEAPDWNGGLPVQGYRVYGISEGTEAELLAELGPEDREFSHGSLVNGMVYLYAVRAYSEVGPSEMSQVIEGRPVGAPSAPQALIAVWTNDMIYVTWSSPMDDGGAPIGGYRLLRVDWNATDWTEVPALGMMYSDEMVEYNVTYTYRVYAYNDVGPGPVVDITITVPPLEEAPQDETDDIWPWIVLAASIAILMLALVIWTRSRRQEFEPEAPDVTEASEAPLETEDIEVPRSDEMVEEKEEV